MSLIGNTLVQLLSAMLGAIIVATGGFFAVKTVSHRQTRKTISSSLAANYMFRYSEPGFLAIRDEVDTFLASLRLLTPAARLDSCAEICRREKPETIRTFNRLHAMGMLFAEIGVGFERDLIDVQGLAIFDRILPYYWQEMSPFIAAAHNEFGFTIDHMRPLSDQQLVLFSKFAYAYNEMHRHGIAKEKRLDV